MMPNPEREGRVGEGASGIGPGARTLTTEGRPSATTPGAGRDWGGRLSSGPAATEDNRQPIRRTLPATLKLARWPHTIRDSPRPRWYCRIFGKKAEGALI